MNTDTRFLNKIWAIQILAAYKKTIHHDQGAIQDWSNIQKKSVIQQINRKQCDHFNKCRDSICQNLTSMLTCQNKTS